MRFRSIRQSLVLLLASLASAEGADADTSIAVAVEVANKYQDREIEPVTTRRVIEEVKRAVRRPQQQAPWHEGQTSLEVSPAPGNGIGSSEKGVVG